MSVKMRFMCPEVDFQQKKTFLKKNHHLIFHRTLIENFSDFSKKSSEVFFEHAFSSHGREGSWGNCFRFKKNSHNNFRKLSETFRTSINYFFRSVKSAFYVSREKIKNLMLSNFLKKNCFFYLFSGFV